MFIKVDLSFFKQCFRSSQRDFGTHFSYQLILQENASKVTVLQYELLSVEAGRAQTASQH